MKPQVLCSPKPTLPRQKGPLSLNRVLYERPLLVLCRRQEQAEVKSRDMSKTLVKR